MYEVCYIDVSFPTNSIGRWFPRWNHELLSLLSTILCLLGFPLVQRPPPARKNILPSLWSCYVVQHVPWRAQSFASDAFAERDRERNSLESLWSIKTRLALLALWKYQASNRWTAYYCWPIQPAVQPSLSISLIQLSIRVGLYNPPRQKCRKNVMEHVSITRRQYRTERTSIYYAWIKTILCRRFT